MKNRSVQGSLLLLLGAVVWGAAFVAQRAGMGFITLEQGTNVLGCLDKADPEGTFLLDSVTALLSVPCSGKAASCAVSSCSWPPRCSR